MHKVDWPSVAGQGKASDTMTGLYARGREGGSKEEELSVGHSLQAEAGKKCCSG